MVALKRLARGLNRRVIIESPSPNRLGMRVFRRRISLGRCSLLVRVVVRAGPGRRRGAAAVAGMGWSGTRISSWIIVPVMPVTVPGPRTRRRILTSVPGPPRPALYLPGPDNASCLGHAGRGGPPGPPAAGTESLSNDSGGPYSIPGQELCGPACASAGDG
jgi:hypothetical protein